jgi:hypothetical protein
MTDLWRRLVLGVDTLWTQLKGRGAERRGYATAVNLACERVVDQANPRLRCLVGYRKALFPVVEECLA